MGSTIRAEFAARRRAWFALALVAALAVAAMALPRLQAGIHYRPVDIALQRYYADRVIPSDRLPVLVQFAGEAIARHDHYRYHDGLSLLHYLRALDPQTPALERRPAYRAAEAEAVAVVQRAPAQPAAWLRLATIRWILHDEPETVVEPWKMSVYTGRMHAALFAARVELGLAYRAYLDEEATAMLRDQLLLAWRLQPGQLVRALARRDRRLDATRALLAGTEPQMLAEMEAWIAKIR